MEIMPSKRQLWGHGRFRDSVHMERDIAWTLLGEEIYKQRKQQLELANWLKEQCKCEAVLRSEGNPKLGAGSLCVILSLLPCWHHVLLQKMGFTQNKENMAMVAPELHS